MKNKVNNRKDLDRRAKKFTSSNALRWRNYIIGATSLLFVIIIIMISMSISHSVDSEEPTTLQLPIVATTQHSTTMTSRPWPGNDSVGLYGYYYCGADESVSFGDLANTNSASFASWKMIVSIVEQDCSTATDEKW
jgi:hypothetical protein